MTGYTSASLPVLFIQPNLHNPLLIKCIEWFGKIIARIKYCNIILINFGGTGNGISLLPGRSILFTKDDRCEESEAENEGKKSLPRKNGDQLKKQSAKI